MLSHCGTGMVSVLKFPTLLACRKGWAKQLMFRPPALITCILFENRKRSVQNFRTFTISISELLNLQPIVSATSTSKIKTKSKPILPSSLNLVWKETRDWQLTLWNQETLKWVFVQTVKTQMKCNIILHFISVYIVCKGQKDLQKKEYNIFF